MKRFHFYEADRGANPTGGTGGVLGAPPAANQTPATSWNWAKEDGTFSDGWVEKLPPEMHGEASLKTIGSVGDLAKSYVATKKLVGTKLEAPGADATPEQLANWRKVVGAPEKPEDYYSGDVKSFRPDNVPEGLWDTESEKKFLTEVAHKHHLSPAVVRDILKFQGDITARAVGKSGEDHTKFLNNEKSALQKEWGGDFDNSSAMVRQMSQMVGMDPDKIHEWTASQTAIAIVKIGKLFGLGGDKLVRGQNSGFGTPDDRLRAIQDSPEYKGERGGERQAEAQKQLHELLKMQGK